MARLSRIAAYDRPVVWVLFLLVAVAVVAVTAALAAGRLPLDAMSDPVHSTPATGLPLGPVAGDVDGVRFDRTLRGYRTDQVDAVLHALRERLAEHERTLAENPAPVPTQTKD